MGLVTQIQTIQRGQGILNQAERTIQQTHNTMSSTLTEIDAIKQQMVAQAQSVLGGIQDQLAAL